MPTVGYETGALASQLVIESAGKMLPDPRYHSVDGVDYTFPWQDIEVAPYNVQFFFGELDVYRAMHELMVEEPLPEHWRQVIREAGDLAKKNGIVYPIDIIAASFHAFSDNPEKAKCAGIEPLGEVEGLGPDFRDKERVRRFVDSIIADPPMREELIKSASVLTPDQSSQWLDFDQVAEGLKHRSGVLLDIGCGVGGSTVSHATDLPNMKVIGSDRQFHERWYRETWEGNESGARFIRADAIGVLPLKQGSVDFATMEFVVDYVSEQGLTKILEEALRVLRVGGVLFVGPQELEGQDGYWRAYEKVIDNAGSISFERISLQEIKDR